MAAIPGRSPIHTPTGTQIALAMAISTNTRAIVASPDRTASFASEIETPAEMNIATRQKANAAIVAAAVYQARSIQRLSCFILRPELWILGMARNDHRKARPSSPSSKFPSQDLRNIVSIHEWGGATPASCSKRKRSAQATSG